MRIYLDVVLFSHFHWLLSEMTYEWLSSVRWSAVSQIKGSSDRNLIPVDELRFSSVGYRFPKSIKKHDWSRQSILICANNQTQNERKQTAKRQSSCQSANLNHLETVLEIYELCFVYWEANVEKAEKAEETQQWPLKWLKIVCKDSRCLSPPPWKGKNFLFKVVCIRTYRYPTTYISFLSFYSKMNNYTRKTCWVSMGVIGMTI